MLFSFEVVFSPLDFGDVAVATLMCLKKVPEIKRLYYLSQPPGHFNARNGGL